MSAPKLGSIAFIPDDRLSRERTAILARAINALRSSVKIDTISASTSEAELLTRLETEQYQLVLVPWYRYLAWTKVEAFYGLTRTSGPTFAGYFCEAIQPYELGEQADHLRNILLDFCYLQTGEIVTLIKALLQEQNRSGIRAFLDDHTPVYVENWMGSKGQGTRSDLVLGLPEFGRGAWRARAQAIRVCLSALWSLVYEEGPGKSEAAQTHQADVPKACFQVAADTGCAVMRLIYTMPTWTPRDALSHFWVNSSQPVSPAQLLARYADFLKVHRIAETGDIEVVVGFFPSAPSEKAFGKLHTHWVEPITAQLVTEIPYAEPGPGSPHLRALTVVGTPRAAPEQGASAKDRFIIEAANKIRVLQKTILEKDKDLRELRSGGVGTAPPVPKSDPEMLLENFQEQYFQARIEIRDIEIQVEDLIQNGGPKNEIELLNRQMLRILEREQNWIKRIVSVLEVYRSSRRLKTGTE